MLTLKVQDRTGVEAVNEPSTEGAKPVESALDISAPSQGAVRLGGRPLRRHAADLPPDNSADEIARIDAELAALRSDLARATPVPAAPSSENDRTLAEIMDSIHYLEAYFAITLPPKLDEIIGAKLNVVAAAERAKRRSRRWLMLSLALNLVLAAGLIAENRNGATGRLATSAASTIEAGAQAFSALVVRGVAKAATLISQVQH